MKQRHVSLLDYARPVTTSKTDPMNSGAFADVARKIEPTGCLRRAWPLAGGNSAAMTALEVARPNGDTVKFVVRRRGARTVEQNTDVAEHEFKLLQALHAGAMAVPRPRLFDRSGDIFPDPYIVVDYADGTVEVAPSDPDEFLRLSAARLAGIHASGFSRQDLPFVALQYNRLSRELARRRENFDHSLDEERILAVVRSAWPFAGMNPGVLLHGDFWTGNLLWDHDRIVAVIDWEDAEVGDPLADLAISRLDFLWLLGVQAMADFTRHYQSMTAITLDNLPYWDLCAALRPMHVIAEWAEPWPALGRPDVTEETMRRDHQMFVAQAMEKLGR